VIESTIQSQMTRVDGTITNYFFMPRPKSRRIIIQHPHFFFDDGRYDVLPPLHKSDEDIFAYKDANDTGRIYEPRFRFEEYTMKHFDKGTLAEFISLSETNWKFGPNDILWFDTCYWSVDDQSNYYFGKGEFTLFDTIRKVSAASFALSIVSHPFIVIFGGEIQKGRVETNSTITIVACNSLLPFADIFEPFRKSLKLMGNTEVRESAFLNDYDERVWNFDLKSASGSLIPEAVMRGQGLLMGQVVLEVVQNDFAPFPISEVNDLRYILASIRGRYEEGDFRKHSNLYLRGDVRDFDKVLIMDSELIMRPDPEFLARLRGINKFPFIMYPDPEMLG
jgi:hypothetical protein